VLAIPSGVERLRLAWSDSCGSGFCGTCLAPAQLACGVAKPELVALAGAVVAYNEARLEPDRSSRWLCSRSLQTGRFLHRFTVAYEQETRSVQVTADGSLAWIQTDNAGYHHGGGAGPRPTPYTRSTPRASGPLPAARRPNRLICEPAAPSSHGSKQTGGTQPRCGNAPPV
jgi:hypothetical protein